MDGSKVALCVDLGDRFSSISFAEFLVGLVESKLLPAGLGWSDGPAVCSERSEVSKLCPTGRLVGYRAAVGALLL